MAKSKLNIKASCQAPHPPRRFDFVIIVANLTEKEETKGILGLKDQNTEGSLTYNWGYIGDRSLLRGVALVCLNDVLGPDPARSATQTIAEILDPDYILVLGIAGGISRKSCKVKIEDIVISYYLHYGTVDKKDMSPLRPYRLLPPSETLYAAACRVAETFRTRNRRVIHDRHIISGASLEDVKTDPIFQNLVNSYPRVAAVEMESGAIARALWDVWQVRRGPGYLVIKGISDLHDFSKDETPAPSTTLAPDNKANKETRSNKEQRDDCGRLAARNSAKFAKQLISEVFRTSKISRPTPVRRLIPDEASYILNDRCSGVLHQISPQEYSEIASFNVERMQSDPSTPKEIFTVCAYEPKELRVVLLEAIERAGAKSEDLIEWAKKHFSHFTVFSDFREHHTGACRRLLVLRDDKWNTSDRLNGDDWDVFMQLNAKMECWGVVRNNLTDKFITDYCVIGDRLLFDYYPQTATLVISEINVPKLSSVLLSLKNDFEKATKRSNTWPFINPRTLRNKAREAFK